jgi:uroporphyrinogen decarboxylase
MNTRERFKEVMNFNTSVAPPKWEFGYWGANYDNWYEEGLPKKQYPRIPDKTNTHVDLYAPCWQSIRGKRLPAGIAVIGGGLYWPTQTFVLDNDVRNELGMDKSQIAVNVNLLFCPQFDVEIVEEDENKLIYVDIDGVKRIFMKDTGVIPSALENVITDWPSWNRLKAERLNLANLKDRLPKHWKRLLENYRNRDYVLVLGGYPTGYFGTLAHLMGYEHLFYNYHDDPKLIHDIQKTFTDLWIGIYEEVLAQTDVDLFIVWEDISAGSGSMVAPKTMREFMLPYYKRLTGFLKSHDVETIFVDTDGDCFEIIPIFIEGGVTGMYPMEVSTGLDLEKVRKTYPTLQLMGGVPKSEIPKGKERINEIMEPVERILQSGGYVPYGDHLIPPEVHWEEFKYYRRKLNGIIDAVEGQ